MTGKRYTSSIVRSVIACYWFCAKREAALPAGGRGHNYMLRRLLQSSPPGSYLQQGRGKDLEEDLEDPAELERPHPPRASIPLSSLYLGRGRNIGAHRGGSRFLSPNSNHSVGEIDASPLP